jgi:hypothetical protein
MSEMDIAATIYGIKSYISTEISKTIVTIEKA